MTKNSNRLTAGIEQKFKLEVADFIKKYPKIEQIHIMFPDMNCVMRGKAIHISALEKITSGSMKMPFSTHGLSIWGTDVEATGLALENGDPDGVFWPILGSLAPAPNSQTHGQILTQLLPLKTGFESLIDPRDILTDMLLKFSQQGLKPVLALELEFYLMSDETPADGPPLPMASGKVQRVNEIDALVDQQGFIDDVLACCHQQNIPIDTIIAEYGRGQFEMNMVHSDDVLQAADHAVLFKHLVRHCAKKHGMRATFMAKPLAGQPGNGLHVHISLLDDAGNNIFATGQDGEAANAALLNAVGGVLDSMPDFQAIFAPHANSYRRFMVDSHAPTNLSWGYDHRGVAIRIPEFKGKNARLEHRVSGADANPYLLLTAILAGILKGLDAQTQPPLAIADGGSLGDYYLTNEWGRALRKFKSSEVVKQAFGMNYHDIYMACRQEEMNQLNAMIPDIEYSAYLHRL